MVSEEFSLPDDGDSYPCEYKKISFSSEIKINQKCESSPVVIKRFSKRLLLISALVGCLFGFFILPYLRGKSEDNAYSFLNILPEDIYTSLLERLPSPLSQTMLYLIANSQSEVNAKNSILTATPGEIAKKANFKAHHPIFIIPGMISTGLELWETDEKGYYESHFRDRLWGTMTMMKFLLFDKKTWLKHISLDLFTGLDPPGIKLRAAQGLGAADFLVPGYWVWGPIIQNLGYIGYDPTNLYMAAYDWRLSIPDLERRDHYFSDLKNCIESVVKRTKIKSVIISHSLGSSVFLYFLSWVSQTDSQWANNHIHSLINIAGPLLGAPKTISSLVSGDMKDTVQLGIFESILVESLLSRKERAYLFRRWPGLLNIVPRGGQLVWSSNPMVYLNNYTLTVDEAIEKLLINSFLVPPETSNRVFSLLDSKEHPWLNPLVTQLPNATNMTIYSFYGVGKETENGYHYKINDEMMYNATFIEMLSQIDSFTEKDILKGILSSGDRNRFQKWLLDDSLFPLLVNSAIDDKDANVVKGVMLVDGDGTVPIRSLGLMGAYFWQKRSFRNLNPHSVKIVTREYLHEPVPMLFISGRGGPRTSDHVDILGNHEMTFDILRIVSGNVNSGNVMETDTNPVSIVNGNIDNLAGNIQNCSIKKLNRSLGGVSGVLYEHNINSTCSSDMKFPSYWCNKKLGIFPVKRSFGHVLPSLQQEKVLELQYANIINRLLVKAVELPRLTNRYYSNIEEIVEECHQKELDQYVYSNPKN